MKLAVEPMAVEDIAQVLEVDRESYSLPWPASAYRREVLHNRNARYMVLREVGDDGGEGGVNGSDHRSRRPFFFRWPLKGDGGDERRGPILGYAGMWLMIDEAHITTIAVREAWRGNGFGELLLASLIDAASEIGAHRMTLEVRVSNEVAQNLYRKYGFQREGTRPRYYSDNNEDAYIMSTGDIRSAEYRRTLETLIDDLRGRLRREQKVLVVPEGTGEPASEGEYRERG